MKLQPFFTRLKSLKWPIALRRVQGHSMVPVLPPGTYIWGWRWFSDLSKHLKVGSVVIFHHDGKEKIKRVADMRDKELYVLGDHEESSTDSRHFGWINHEQVLAIVFWPHAPKDRAENVEAD